MLALIYLAAIVPANLLIATYGPQAAPFVAFAFIGLDLTLRDALHEQWQGQGLWLRMALLIAAGGAISWAFNAGSGRIALASFVAFVAAGAADALIYHALRERAWGVRANGSNIVGAGVDSLIFPSLAFGALLPVIILAQFVAKVAGGAVWAFLIGRRKAQIAALSPEGG